METRLALPTRKSVRDVAQRIERLSIFEAKSKRLVSSTAILREAAGAELWDAYWDKLDQIRGKLHDADKDAEVIRLRLDAAFIKAKTSNSDLFDDGEPLSR